MMKILQMNKLKHSNSNKKKQQEKQIQYLKLMMMTMIFLEELVDLLKHLLEIQWQIKKRLNQPF